MLRDFTAILWLLKFGALLNLCFLVSTGLLASGGGDPAVMLPAAILFAVNAYRCLFPVRYEHNVVLHDTIFSSIFVTRLLATFSEVAYIFLFAYVLRLLNVDHTVWVNVLSWLMVAQVVISQGFVWSAILTERFELYVYEELGWFLIFAANTIVSADLYWTVGASGGEAVLLKLNLIFGVLYLPWQVLHLRSLRANAKRNSASTNWLQGLERAIRVKNRRTDADSWGGFIGLTWMTAYWATLIPMWTYYIVRVLGAR
jgi:hypothetical protein